MASRVVVGQIWASNHRGDRESGVRQHREVVAVDVDRAELLTAPGNTRSKVLLRVSGDRTTILNHRLVGEPAPDQPRATSASAADKSLSADELLARVHERLGGLGVDISTFGETGQVEVRWKRAYPGGWSNERFFAADSLCAALRGVLELEDEADREEAASLFSCAED